MATRQEQLKHIYSSSLNGLPRFDDGGSLDYIDTGSTPYYQADNSGGYNLSVSNPDTNPIPNEGPIANSGSPSGTNYMGNLAPTVLNTNTPNNPSKGSLGAAASSVLKSLGLGGGDTSNTALLGALTGILGAVGQYAGNKGAATKPAFAAPALFGGAAGTVGSPNSSASTGWGPAGGYNKANYASSSAIPAGYGYAPVTQTAPKASYYTYGSGPEQQFFQQVNPSGGPIAPVTAQAKGGPIHLAHGGSVPRFDMGGISGTPSSNALPTMPPQGGGGGAYGGLISPTAPTPASAATAAGGAPTGALGAMGAPAGMARPSQMPAAPMMPQRPMSAQPRPAVAPSPQQSVMAQRMRMAGPQPMADGGQPDTPTYAGDVSQFKYTPAPILMSQSQNLAALRPTLHHTSAMPAGVHMAMGGALPGNMAPGPEMGSRHIIGPGDGTSDSINARLANGEYVMDSQAVSMLGNGSNSAGAAKLDAFRKNLRQHKGGALSQGRMAPNAKPIEHYMSRASK